MNTSEKVNFISNWIKNYADKGNFSSLVIGISGGIDSAVTSTLSARTNLHTHVVTMPILDHQVLNNRGNNHIEWLKRNYSNISHHHVNLSKVFDEFQSELKDNSSEHGYANSRARLRMATLYQVAAANSGIVVGTGNKVEDFGVGFYTKYGDGGVDISPIADCTKTQVWELGKHLGVSEDIINTPPTDGLWDDGRNDVQQLGMSYEDLEKAMVNKNDPNYQKYLEIREKNLHKMNPIPVCKFNE